LFNFLPLDEQYDSGFGVTADAFHEAANLLAAGPLFLNQNMPIGFLLRHAIELYLKSVVLVLHRRLNIPWSKTARNNDPWIRIGGKDRPLFNTHGIADLYGYVAGLFRRYQRDLDATTTTDWESAFTPEIEEFIRVIDSADISSTLFRYPVSGNDSLDAEKSSVKRYTLDELAALPHLAPGVAPMKAVITYDDNDEVVATYAMDHSAIESVHKALTAVTEHFSTLHFAVRMELARGA
jgi:hypothetical protein